MDKTQSTVSARCGSTADAVRQAAIVMAIVTPLVGLVGGPGWALGVGAGAVWNLINLSMLALWSRFLTMRGKVKGLWMLLVGVIKFPVLYGVGIWALVTQRVPAIPFVIGFTAVLGLVAFHSMARIRQA